MKVCYYSLRDDPRAYWGEVIKIITNLLEGPNGVRGEWVYGVANNKLKEGGWWDFGLMDRPPNWAKAASGYRASNRSRHVPRVAVLTTEDSFTLSGACHALSQHQRAEKLQAVVYVTDEEEIRKYSKQICHYHGVAMFNRLMADVSLGLTEQEAQKMVDEKCHTNDMCISEWNIYVTCTLLPGGFVEVQRRAEMMEGSDKRELYTKQLHEIFRISTSQREAQRGIHLMMEDSEGHYVCYGWEEQRRSCF